MVNYSEEIARLRRDLGVSQETFAHLIGVRVVSISRWENDRHKPSQLSLSKMRRFLKKKGWTDEQLPAWLV